MTVAELESSLWAAEDSSGLHALESANKGGQIREKGIKAHAHREQFAYGPKGKPCHCRPVRIKNSNPLAAGREPELVLASSLITKNIIPKG